MILVLAVRHLSPILFLSFYLTFAHSSLPEENGVLNEPRVFCGPDGVHVLVRTHGPFRGRLFVQEESERPECIHGYVDEVDGDDRRPADSVAEFHLKFGACSMRRQRTLNPRGVTFSFNLVVSFHPLFLTAADRVFNVRCFFIEAVKAVDAALDVSQMATEVIEQGFPLPRCNYHLKRGGFGGSILRYVWECDPSAGWVYGMLIHSCYVDDGRGNRFELINGRGCATDKLLLGDLRYDEHRLSAYVDSRVFKYADRIQLFFTCTVQLCFRQDGGCEGITPPNCGSFPDHHLHEFHSRIRLPNHVQRPHNGQSPAEIFRQISRQRVFRPSTSRSSSSSEHDEYDRLLKDDVLLLNETQLFPNDGGDYENTTESGRQRPSRDAFNPMETDLSAELTVMPLDGQADEEEMKYAISRHDLPRPSSTQFCMNRMNVFSLLAAFFLSILLTVLIVAFCVRRHRLQTTSHHHHRMSRKIFLTN